MIEIGEKIKQARLEKNMPLEEISNRLRISLAYLNDIEQGKFDFLPKPYVLAFVKIFANYVGLNGEELVVPMREPARPPSPMPVPAAPEADWMEPAPVKPRKRATASAAHGPAPGSAGGIPYAREIAISFGIILVIAALLYFASRSSEGFPEEPQKESAVTPPAAQDSPQEVSLERMVQEAQAFAKPDSTLEPQGLTLTAKINAQVWMRLITDGKDTLTATFPAGTTETWHAKENFKLRVGNVSALTLTLNDKRLENLGPAGRSSNLTITRDGTIVQPPRTGRSRRAPIDTTRR